MSKIYIKAPDGRVVAAPRLSKLKPGWSVAVEAPAPAPIAVEDPAPVAVEAPAPVDVPAPTPTRKGS